MRSPIFTAEKENRQRIAACSAPLLKGDAILDLQASFYNILRSAGWAAKTGYNAGMTIQAVQLGLFANRMAAIADEMGVVLRRAAFSPNIKDRLDYSCAVFDAKGSLCAQAAHIPVHLGSMAYAARGVIESFEWRSGDTVILNDPFNGGTHLPDITLMSPVFYQDCLVAFVANRAHHANVGSESPGSMPISKSLHEEGVLISPTLIGRQFELDQGYLKSLLAELGGSDGADIVAQWSANRRGIERMTELLESYGDAGYQKMLQDLQDYGTRLALQTLADLPRGEFSFEDVLDDDGQGNTGIPIRVKIRISESRFEVDFSGSAGQVKGNLNCPISVTAASVYYVFRCLLPESAPTCAGVFSPVTIIAPEASLLNAQFPAAVAAGNVETSQRITDALLGAMQKALPDRMPAASQGTMNNLAMGGFSQPQGASWSYYETLAGGTGGHGKGAGLSARHSHMTNTLNTPIESLESHFPLRVTRYEIRRNSGGLGKFVGGDGLIREYEFLQPARATLLTERRAMSPWGVAGGGDGRPGFNSLNGKALVAKVEVDLSPGDQLCIETPGGGAWGSLSPDGEGS